AGDAWERAQADSCGVPTPQAGAGSSAGGAPRVSLGLPSLRVPTAAGDGSAHPRHRA
ncbi:tRNA (N6-isopentenyl adenosine(37)-C2)-methylthiotransferase MiaB, partial [Clavibacter michiganensis]